MLVTDPLAEGANVNAVSPNGTLALMMAVREGKGSTVTLLIARGANVSQRNQGGAMALSGALRGNEQEMAAALRRAARRRGAIGWPAWCRQLSLLRIFGRLPAARVLRICFASATSGRVNSIRSPSASGVSPSTRSP